MARAILLDAVLVVLTRGAVCLADPPTTEFSGKIEPLLENYCFGCHGDGAKKGGVSLDAYREDAGHLSDVALWHRVWRMLDSELMPPAKKEKPSLEERKQMQDWIVRAVLRLDASRPDPGRVTIRRLNREEYRYTVRDLLDVDFDATDAFPADDTGYGFDTVGDALTISPLLLEKYLDASQEIIRKWGEMVAPRAPVIRIAPEDLVGGEGNIRTAKRMPLREAVAVRADRSFDEGGRFRLRAEGRVLGAATGREAKASLVVVVNGKDVLRQPLSGDQRGAGVIEAEVQLPAGESSFVLRMEPSGPASGVPPPVADGAQGDAALAVATVQLEGPLDGKRLEYPPPYRKFFGDAPAPKNPTGREELARKLIRRFADRALRRPVDDATVDRLMGIARQTWAQAGASFEEGIAQMMTAVLALPRFLFRAEAQPSPDDPGRTMPLDDYALASRLSYFLWSSLPDDRLYELAAKGQLRGELRAQVDRMLADPKAERFVRNFVGQWLQTRDVEAVAIDARRVLGLRSQEEAAAAFGFAVRRAMRAETEMFFAHLLRTGGTLTDLLTADYTFLNEPLARFYGISRVAGPQMRKVQLEAGTHRRGILTQGSFLVVSSNPTRTSPVKRGLYILENLLGTAPPPPPPDVPALEAAAKGSGRPMTMRELMVAHREQPMCASCHVRMDPPGLAFENFNALGQYRESDRGQLIDAAGQLSTGEPFQTAEELVRILTTSRRRDLYRCATEKILTYALGRGIEYFDIPTVEAIISKLEEDGGRIRTLVHCVVESPAFQMRRGDGSRTPGRGSSRH